MRKSPGLGFEKHSKNSMSVVADKINKVVKENKEQNKNNSPKVGGVGIASEVSSEKTYLNYIIGGIALLLVLAMSAVFIRKKQRSQN